MFGNVKIHVTKAKVVIGEEDQESEVKDYFGCLVEKGLECCLGQKQGE